MVVICDLGDWANPCVFASIDSFRLFHHAEEAVDVSIVDSHGIGRLCDVPSQNQCY